MIEAATKQIKTKTDAACQKIALPPWPFASSWRLLSKQIPDNSSMVTIGCADKKSRIPLIIDGAQNNCENRGMHPTA
jgi:hypothetical protein